MEKNNLDEQAEVAAKLYSMAELPTPWDQLTAVKKKPYMNMAGKLIKGEADIFAQLTAKYCVQLGVPSKYKTIISGIISAALGALAVFGALGQSSCTYADVSKDRAVICNGESCVIVSPGRLTFTQEQPKTDAGPVVIPSKEYCK
jgi:hypothetical protein